LHGKLYQTELSHGRRMHGNIPRFTSELLISSALANTGI
jgi:hypothetical protein